MSIEKLISTLKKEALDREEALMVDARREVDDITSNANELTSGIDRQIAWIAKESDERKKLVRSGKAALEKRNLSASIENRFIAEIAARCRVLYSEFMEKKEYSDIVKSDFAKIKAELKEIGEIRADPVTAKILKKLNGTGKVVEDEKLDYGFTAVTPNRETKLHSTFNNSLEKLWGEVAPEFVRNIGDVIDGKH